MHWACEKFIDWTIETFQKYLSGGICEFGSCDVNSEIRSSFGKNAKEYIGIDWRDGKNVDVVCLAHEYETDKKFRCIISTSMLEHDRHWKDSITNMVNYLEDNGMLVLTWGSAINQPHCSDHADDNGFHSLKAGLVENLLKELNMNIHTLCYDADLPFYDKKRGTDQPVWKKYEGIYDNGYGEINLIAFKGDMPDVEGFKSILIKEDILYEKNKSILAKHL